MSLPTTSRSASIDVFRGMTILLMIFVNDLAGVAGIPSWLKHMPADVDGMSLADVVFPAFLFIVGLSLPLALKQRQQSGAGRSLLMSHQIRRSVSLIIIGVMMVNAEDGFTQSAMPISIHLWSALMLLAVVLVWHIRFKNIPRFSRVLSSIGVLLLLSLALVYRSGENGLSGLQPQWWGILGLIGWSSLFAGMVVIFFGATLPLVLFSNVICVAGFVGLQPDYLSSFSSFSSFSSAFSLSSLSNDRVLHFLSDQANQFTHVMLVMAGAGVSQLLFSSQASSPATSQATSQAAQPQRAGLLAVWCIAAFLIAMGLHLVFPISKIHATPSWAWFSIAICSSVMLLLYVVIDVLQWRSWYQFLMPAAQNSLFIYLLPFFIYSVSEYFQLVLVPVLRQGALGMLWSIFYVALMIAMIKLFNRLGLRLKL